MTVNFTPFNSPSSTAVEKPYKSPMKSKQSSSTLFFSDLSNAKHWSEIEATLANASRIGAGLDGEIGWIEGCIYETKSTQKEVEILLVHPPHSSDAIESHEALRVYINCPEFSRFVFAINQDIKIALSGARIIRELCTPSSGILPFSLVFSSKLAILSVRGGVCMPDGIVVDSRQDRDCYSACARLESATSTLSLDDGTHIPLRTSPRLTQKVPTPLDGSNADVLFDEYTAYPVLNSLAEGMMTPLLGIVEAIKPVSTTATGELCVSVTLADASSYESKRGFRVTCFTTRSRLARDLPNPAVGDAILLKAVKINKWSNGLIGSVYPNKLDWISYNPSSDVIDIPGHAKSDTFDTFYDSMEKRKDLFRHFIAAMKSGSWESAGSQLPS